MNFTICLFLNLALACIHLPLCAATDNAVNVECCYLRKIYQENRKLSALLVESNFRLDDTAHSYLPIKVSTKQQLDEALGRYLGKIKEYDASWIENRDPEVDRVIRDLIAYLRSTVPESVGEEVPANSDRPISHLSVEVIRNRILHVSYRLKQLLTYVLLKSERRHLSSHTVVRCLHL